MSSIPSTYVSKGNSCSSHDTMTSPSYYGSNIQQPMASADGTPLPLVTASCPSNYSGSGYVAVATATPIVMATPSAAAVVVSDGSAAPYAAPYATSVAVVDPAPTNTYYPYNNNNNNNNNLPPMAAATTDATSAVNAGHYVPPTIFTPSIHDTSSSFTVPSIFRPPPGYVAPSTTNTNHPRRHTTCAAASTAVPVSPERRRYSTRSATTAAAAGKKKTKSKSRIAQALRKVMRS